MRFQSIDFAYFLNIQPTFFDKQQNEMHIWSKDLHLQHDPYLYSWKFPLRRSKNLIHPDYLFYVFDTEFYATHRIQ